MGPPGDRVEIILFRGAEDQADASRAVRLYRPVEVVHITDPHVPGEVLIQEQNRPLKLIAATITTRVPLVIREAWIGNGKTSRKKRESTNIVDNALSAVVSCQSEEFRNCILGFLCMCML